jgi:hypothetical protein
MGVYLWWFLSGACPEGQMDATASIFAVFCLISGL